MDEERFAKLAEIYNGLKPEELGTNEFPDKQNLGVGKLDDAHLAQIIYYGTGSDILDDHLEFAIRLGRELEKKGL